MIKNRLTFVIGVLVVAVLLAYMFLYQVRYNEQAVVATFDKATQADVVTEPGLRFRWPRPIQTVKKYSTMLQVMDDPLEQRMTRDGATVIIREYVAWRIVDPYNFFVSLRDETNAERLLGKMTGDLSEVYGKYSLDQLVNTDPSRLKLREIETEAAAFLNNRLEQTEYGIRVEQVGIRRVMLPADVTTKVFGRMRDVRMRMAQLARSAGAAEAEGIRSEAEKIAEIIMAFAEGRASAIRAEGDEEAIEAYKLFSPDPEFAIFLQELAALEQSLAGEKTTLVLDADSLSLFDLFARGPDGRQRPAGGVEAPAAEPQAATPAGAPAAPAEAEAASDELPVPVVVK